VTLAAALPARAMTEADAHAAIDRVVQDINKVINSGQSESAMLKEFQGIFSRYADVPTIARAALGPPARSATPAQMRAFTDAFSAYISRKYGKRFREFIGGKVEVTGVRTLKSFYEVQAIAVLQGEAPFAVSFMVSDKSGSVRFFDMLIEGISLLKAEKSEIGAMLDQAHGNIDTLIQMVQGAG